MLALELLIKAGKIISGAKAVKNVADFVTEDREAKRKERKRKAEEKRLDETIEQIENRNFFEALIMYVIAGAAGFFCMGMGIFGAVLVVIFFIAHLSELYKLHTYVSIRREIILTVLLGLFFIGFFIKAII